MALGFRLTCLAGLLAACSAGGAADQAVADQEAAAAPAPAERLDSAEIAGLDLSLRGEAGQCILDLAGVRHPLGLEAPCAFLRRSGARLAMHDYGQWGAVVLVGGPPAPDEAYRADVGRTPADRCSNTGRAIILSNTKVALSDLKSSPLWFCPDSAPDEKFYYGIAHERPFAGRKTLN